MIFLIIAMLAIFASASQSEQNSRLRKLNGALTKVWKELAVGGALPACWIRLPTGCEKGLGETNDPTKWFKDPHNGDTTSCSSTRLAAFENWCQKQDGENFWGTEEQLPGQDEPAASEVSEPATGCATLVKQGYQIKLEKNSDFPLTTGTTALSSCTDRKREGAGCMNLQQCQGLCDARSKDLFEAGVCAVERIEKWDSHDVFWQDTTASCYFVPNVDGLVVPDGFQNSSERSRSRWTSSCTKPATSSVLPEYPDCRVMDSDDEKMRVNSNFLTGTICPDKMSVHGMTATKRMICCPKN